MVGVAVIAIPMLLYGATSFAPDEASTEVIKVGDHGIVASVFENELNIRLDAVAEQLGFDPTDPPPGIRAEVLQQVTNTYLHALLLLNVADSEQLTPSDAEIVSLIRSEPSFFVDGQFSPERFQQIVTQPAQYFDSVRNTVARLRLNDSVINTGIAVEDLIRHIERYRGERRVIRKKVIPVTIDETIEFEEIELQSTYELQIESQYTLPDQVRFEYLLIDDQAVAHRVQVDEEKLREAHTLRTERNQATEERQLSLIMLASEDEANSTLAEIEAGADFATLASNRSIDEGTKSVGGDLGLLSKDDLSPEIAQAVFSAEIGDTVGPFNEDDAWLLFRVDGKLGGQVASFEDVRDDLVRQVTTELTELEVNNVATELDNLVGGKNVEDLTEVTETFGISPGSTELIALSEDFEFPAPLDDEGLLPNLLNPELHSSGNFSSVLRKDDGSYLLVRVTEFEPSRVQEFEEVRDKVIEELQLFESVSAKGDEIREQFEKLLANEEVPELNLEQEEELELDLLSSDEELEEIGLNRELLDLLFSDSLVLSENGLPGYYLTYQPVEQNFVMFRVDEILPSPLPSETVSETLAYIASEAEASMLLSAFLDEISGDFDRTVDIPETISAQWSEADT